MHHAPRVIISPGEAQPLLQRVELGDLRLPNRIVMAPLTRSRATNDGLVPTELYARYYAQRASAGLIVSEGTWISPSAIGWNDVPGLFTPEQISGWRRVTEAVHRAGGLIFAQLWHTGSVSHPVFFDGHPPLGPSPINPLVQAPTRQGRNDTVTPREMDLSDINSAVRDFAEAANNAMRAGFDGIQLQAGFQYLINQFLHTRTNQRTDQYGGSRENRARFLFEVLDAVSETVGAERVGVKTGPALSEEGMFVTTEETIPTSDYVIGRLNEYRLSHLLLMGAMADLSATPAAELAGDGMYLRYRHRYRGTLIANVGIDQQRGNRLIAENLADLVAFGRPFIANPDLPMRFARGADLVDPDRSRLYSGGPRGYVDYPAMETE
jgi:N-ethylmaleimide reductase